MKKWEENEGKSILGLEKFKVGLWWDENRKKKIKKGEKISEKGIKGI